jgi:hypothetical protein
MTQSGQKPIIKLDSLHKSTRKHHKNTLNYNVIHTWKYCHQITKKVRWRIATQCLWNTQPTIPNCTEENAIPGYMQRRAKCITKVYHTIIQCCSKTPDVSQQLYHKMYHKPNVTYFIKSMLTNQVLLANLDWG